MKTSIKVLLSYIGVLLLSFTGFVIYSMTEPRNPKKRDFYEHEIQLQPFSVVYIKDGQYNLEERVESNRIKLHSNTDSIFNSLSYQVSNDTLFISVVNAEQNYSVNIGIKKSDLKEIICLNSRLGIRKMQHPNLELNLQSSHIYFDNETEIDTLKINGTDNAEVQSSSLNTNFMDVALNNSKMDHYSGIKHIKVNLRNNSRIKMHQPGTIEIDKDSTSVINIY